MASGPNDYYVNVVTKSIQRQSNPLLAAALHAAGYTGPYSLAQAQNLAGALKSPGVAATTPVTTTLGDSINNISNPLSGLLSIGDFFGRLEEASTWERVGEIAVGLILLYVGLKALTGNSSNNNSKPKSSLADKAATVAAVAPK